MARHRMIGVVILFILSTVSMGDATDIYQWKAAGTQDGCQIYVSDVAGKEYIAAKATCDIPAGMDVIGVILRDIAGYPRWMHDCSDTKIIQVIDDEKDVFIFWFRQHVSLFSDRDMVLKSKTLYYPDKGQSLIYADSTDETAYDSGKKYVRMPSFKSLYVLEYLERDKTRVTLMIDPDLGKGLPVSVANRSIKSTPLQTLNKMASMAKQKRYIEAAKGSKYSKFIEEYLAARKK